MKPKIKILYEDEAIVIINKPPRFLTIPDRYAHQLASVYGFLKQRYGEIFIVHRLDRETSGILCFARTREAHRDLSRKFEARTVDKIYLALIDGHILQKEGIIDKPIAESLVRQGKMVINKRGKPSVTIYKVIEEFRQFSLLEAQIKTGRTHQIRVHLESIGNPLAIDAVYGLRKELLLSTIKRNKYKIGKNQEERPLMTRSTLHAYSLAFLHPTTQTPIAFKAELPKDFKAVVKQLRKWGR